MRLEHKLTSSYQPLNGNAATGGPRDLDRQLDRLDIQKRRCEKTSRQLQPLARLEGMSPASLVEEIAKAREDCNQGVISMMVGPLQVISVVSLGLVPLLAWRHRKKFSPAWLMAEKAFLRPEEFAADVARARSAHSVELQQLQAIYDAGTACAGRGPSSQEKRCIS